MPTPAPMAEHTMDVKSDNLRRVLRRARKRFQVKGSTLAWGAAAAASTVGAVEFRRRWDAGLVRRHCIWMRRGLWDTGLLVRCRGVVVEKAEEVQGFRLVIREITRLTERMGRTI